jgi:hypothetical protein
MATSIEPEDPSTLNRSTAEVIEKRSSTEVIDDSSVEQPAGSMEQVEEVAKQAGRAANDALHTAGEAARQSAGEAMNAARASAYKARESASRMYRETRARAKEGYAQASRTTQEVALLAWRSAKLAKREYPVQTLGVLAGAAFLMGIILRVRKERRA